MKPPRKHKPVDELSVEEHVARHRGEPAPMTDEFRDYVLDVAEAAGLAAEDLGLQQQQQSGEHITAAEVETLSVEDLVERRRNRNRN